ncbi:hypothetical protein ACFQ5F_05860 [Kroppenstedtia eburnea]|uniref:hypothetical protein n=1 Tax=Kroppenstedtia eburnea TaxID=714067 RepID=UPI000310A3E8
MHRSKVATVVLSIVPGLGHFYLGLMNRGLQLMIAFFGLLLLADLFRLSYPFPAWILWFYSIFDAVHQHRKTEEEGKVTDLPFVQWSRMGQPTHRWFGWLLVLVGVYFLLDNLLPGVFGWEIYEMIRKSLLALVLIWLGCRLLLGKPLLPTISKERSYHP